MVANVVRYRARSAVREVGKALGLSETALDRLAKLLSHHGPLDAAELAQAGLDPATPLHEHFIRAGPGTSRGTTPFTPAASSSVTSRSTT